MGQLVGHIDFVANVLTISEFKTLFLVTDNSCHNFSSVVY